MAIVNPTNAKSDDNDVDRNEEKPLKKKAKTEFSFGRTEERTNTTKPVKRVASKGKLALLLSLPLDVLFEVESPFYRSMSNIDASPQIFGHLAPLDVITLARTTRSFRRVCEAFLPT